MADFVAENIIKEFETPSEPLRILDGVSVELNRGENLAIVGPSGSGKSTFLHIAGTLDQATSGRMALLGTELNQIPENQLPPFRNQHVGFIFQEHHLLPQLSALENVLIPVLATGSTDSQSVERAKRLLEAVGLTDRASHRPAELSGGERQRVAVARALIRNPVMLLADEPTGNLDPANAERIGQLLLELQQQEHTILICVTHSSALAAMFQRSVCLESGKFTE